MTTLNLVNPMSREERGIVAVRSLIDPSKGYVQAPSKTAERVELQDAFAAVSKNNWNAFTSGFEAEQSQVNKNFMFLALNVLDFDTAMEMFKHLVAMPYTDRLAQEADAVLDREWSKLEEDKRNWIRANAVHVEYFENQLADSKQHVARLENRVARLQLDLSEAKRQLGEQSETIAAEQLKAGLQWVLS